MDVISFYDIKKYTLIKKKDSNNRDIRLYCFDNVILTGMSYFYPDILLKCNDYKHLILPIKEMTLSLNKKSYYEENGMILKHKIKSSVEDDFVYINETVYGMDEDAPKKGELKTFRTLLNKQRSAQVYRWIDTNWDSVSAFITKLFALKDTDDIKNITIPFKEYRFRDPRVMYGEPPNKDMVLQLFV